MEEGTSAPFEKTAMAGEDSEYVYDFFHENFLSSITAILQVLLRIPLKLHHEIKNYHTSDNLDLVRNTYIVGIHTIESDSTEI